MAASAQEEVLSFPELDRGPRRNQHFLSRLDVAAFLRLSHHDVKAAESLNDHFFALAQRFPHRLEQKVHDALSFHSGAGELRHSFNHVGFVHTTIPSISAPVWRASRSLIESLGDFSSNKIWCISLTMGMVMPAFRDRWCAARAVLTPSATIVISESACFSVRPEPIFSPRLRLRECRDVQVTI